VSGAPAGSARGAPAGDERAARGRGALTEAPLDPAALLAEVVSPAHGATALFVGTVRDVNDGRAVLGIDYTAYAPMAARELDAIAGEVAARHGARVALEHRVGALVLGEASVAIAAAHVHRAPAFAACREAIEEIKRRVPIWKREHYADGERVWVDPTLGRGAPTPAAGAPDGG
jgi:molybdopterin synthase catalytic subunit